MNNLIQYNLYILNLYLYINSSCNLKIEDTKSMICTGIYSSQESGEKISEVVNLGYHIFANLLFCELNYS